MVAHGKLQSEAAKALGVSIMTYYRWRKTRAAAPARPSATGIEEPRALATEGDSDALVAKLQIENSRLRRIVADLFLEKVQLQEALDREKSGT